MFSPQVFIIDYCLTTMQLQNQNSKNQIQKYSGSFDVFFKTLKERGIFGFFKSFPFYTLRKVASFLIYFGSYETTYRLLSSQEDLNRPKTLWMSLIAGGVAGTITWVFVYPLSTFQTILFADDFKSPKYKNYLDIAV